MKYARNTRNGKTLKGNNDAFMKKVIEWMFKYMNVIGKTFALNVMIKNVGTQEN